MSELPPTIDLTTLPEPVACGKCGHTVANITDTGRHIKAECALCSTYVKFVSKADLGMEPRSLKTRDSVSVHTRRRILERDGHRCQDCGRAQHDGINLDVDHIIPKHMAEQAGWLDEWVDHDDNLVTTCETCNSGKTDRLPTARHIARLFYIRDFLQKREP